MSIPWRGCSAQHVAELAAAVATFLSPFALILLSKKITSLAKRAREQGKAQTSRSSPTSSDSSDPRKENLYILATAIGDSAVDRRAQEEGGVLRQGAPRSLDENRNEAEQQSERHCRIQIAYCTCDSSVNEFSGNIKPQLDTVCAGEIIGDCNKKPLDQMDPLLFSKEFQQELAQACELPGEQNRKLDSACSDYSTFNKRGGKGTVKTNVNPTAVHEPTTGRSTLERNEWEQRGSCTDLIDQLKDLTISCDAEQSFPPSLPVSSKATKDANRTAELLDSFEQNSVDQRTVLSESEKKIQVQGLPCSGYKAFAAKIPRNQTRGHRWRTNTDPEAQDSRTENTEPEREESQLSVGDDSNTNTVLEGSPLEATTDSTQFNKSKHSGSTQGINCGRMSSMVDGPTRRHDNTLEKNVDAATTENRQAVSESVAEPRDAYTLSSSCESFSTANCSSSCSSLTKNNKNCAAQQSDNHSAKVCSESRGEDQDPQPLELVDRKNNRKGRRTHGCKVQENFTLNTISTAVSKLVSPSSGLTSSARGRLRHREYGRRMMKIHQDSPASDESQVTLDSSDDSSESDDDSSSNRGESEAEADEEETQDITKWLASALMSWLPDFKKGRRQTKHRPPAESVGTKTSEAAQKKKNVVLYDDDERFDVRNILKVDQQQQSLWACIGASTSGTRACPHSCVSSLCNFRRTLESWKIQLLAMHAALDASSTALGSGSSSSHWRCNFCKEEKPRSSDPARHQCYTLHIARVFWRMVLQFKRFHLQTSTCPYIAGDKQRCESSQGLTVGDNADPRPCSLGHMHSCDNDYSGCSQHMNTPISIYGEDATQVLLEAPCVHVLLDDVDKLLSRLENMKQSYSSQSSGSQLSDQQTDAVKPTKSSDHRHIPSGCDKGSRKGSVPSTNSLTTKAVEVAQPENRATLEADDVELPSRKTSSPGLISPSPSISLPGDLADLEEELISCMRSEFTARSNSSCSERDTEEEYLEDERGRVIAVQGPAFEKSEQEKKSAPERLSEEVSSGKEPPSSLTSQEITQPASLSAYRASDSQMLQPTASRSRDSPTGKLRSSMSQQLAACSTRALGKFALRYLEHIEKKLDEEMLGECSPSSDTSCPTRIYSGDSLKTLRQAALLAANQTHPSGELAETPAQVQPRLQSPNDAPSRRSELSSSENSIDPITRLKSQSVTGSDKSQHSSSEGIRQSLAESLKGSQKDPSLVSAFREIISDLNKLQAGQQVSRCRMADTKTTLPGLMKSRSVTKVSSFQDSNPASVRSVVPSSSSCISLTTSSTEEDVDQKDMSVTQAFDQLDKVVNDLLHLIDVQQSELA